MTTNEENEMAISINQKSTVSLALVVVIIGGIVANVGMVFDLKSDVALVQRDVVHVMDGTREIREHISAISVESRKGLDSVRSEVATMREQLFELRTRTHELEKTKDR